MQKQSLGQLFEQLDALTVGFSPIFRDFNQTTTYPPHNIVRVSDTEFYLELAVAGFKKTDVEMEIHQGLLTIKGAKLAENGTTGYQHRGIANRSFTKSFQIAEYFEVSNASLEDGILMVSFTKNVPEEAKPKLIAIN